MAEQELNLFQLSSRIVAESGTRSSEVVWREFGNSQSFRVFLHNVPDYFLCNFSSPDNTFAANASKNLTVRDLSDSQPVIYRLLHPLRHRNRADVSSFPDEVNYGPAVFSALNMVKGQINEFSSTEPTP
jgi:hypothetical protein